MTKRLGFDSSQLAPFHSGRFLFGLNFHTSSIQAHIPSSHTKLTYTTHPDRLGMGVAASNRTVVLLNYQVQNTSAYTRLTTQINLLSSAFKSPITILNFENEQFSVDYRDVHHLVLVTDTLDSIEQIRSFLEVLSNEFGKDKFTGHFYFDRMIGQQILVDKSRHHGLSVNDNILNTRGVFKYLSFQNLTVHGSQGIVTQYRDSSDLACSLIKLDKQLAYVDLSLATIFCNIANT